MRLNKRIHLLLTVFLLLLSQTYSWSQAYCALRDPVNSIYNAFPEANTYKSVVRLVNEQTRLEISEQLPFTLHFNELGQHTLYIAAFDKKPLGMIHVRSESGSWGLVEIAWSLTADLRIKDFNFQRCRSRQRGTVESEDFKQQIRGKSFAEIRVLLNETGDGLNSSQLKVNSLAKELVVTVLRSALKTLLVTELTWKQDVALVRVLSQVYAFFPTANKLERFDSIYTETVVRELREFTNSDSGSPIDRENSLGVRLLDEDGKLMGHVFKTSWESLGIRADLWWSIGSDMIIREVLPDGDWPSDDVAAAFMEVNGMNYSDIHNCQSAAQIVGAEMLIMCKALETGEG